jgi:hypothetical protein
MCAYLHIPRIRAWGDKENVNQLVSNQPGIFNFLLFKKNDHWYELGYAA